MSCREQNPKMKIYLFYTGTLLLKWDAEWQPYFNRHVFSFCFRFFFFQNSNFSYFKIKQKLPCSISVFII